MIALITMTGYRPEQINICSYLMKRQTYTGKVLWIIVDDVLPITTHAITEDFRENWTIVKIHPVPAWEFGQNTQSRNIAAGIEFLKLNYLKKSIDGIFIIEDDDYYHANYLERMVAKLDKGDLIGETNTIYYNVQWRQYGDNNNKLHSSLFQTAFKWNVIPVLEAAYNNRFIDCLLWDKAKNKYLFFENQLSLGIKGMPGRAGIGAGHTSQKGLLKDPSMDYIKSRIGDDYKLYQNFYIHKPTHNNFWDKRK